MKRPTVRNISEFLDKILRVRKIPDASVNGLQVRPDTNREIRKVGFAVDACIPTFQKAKKLNAGLLVVHHGIKWKPQKDRNLTEKRAAVLRKNKTALYAVHLPLDLHNEYGNNIQLARIFDLKNIRKFGRYHGVKIGVAGTFRSAIKLSQAGSALERHLKSPCRVFPFGKDRIRTIGIISGGGGSMLNQAVREELDCFLVGEIDLAVYNAAKDYGMSMIVAGHYATETVGVRALMPLVERAFGVDTVFIEDRKGL